MIRVAFESNFPRGGGRSRRVIERDIPGIRQRRVAMAEKKIIVSARGKGLRVSVHIFNNFDDIDRLIIGLRELPSTAGANTA